MRRLGRATVGVIAGYAVGVGVGVLLSYAFSTNTHDKSVEMATTSALITGPLGALIGLGLGFRIRR